MANNIIGRVLATEKNPTTIDDFTFWTDPELILNPFDIVKVQHVNNSFSYGVIEDIAHITDAASFLTNFISSDFGDVDAEENTLRVGMNYVSAKVICNTANIYIPLQSNAKVMLATADEINYALGLKDIRNPLVYEADKLKKKAEETTVVTKPEEKKKTFVTDSFSKLSRSERKLVSKILTIITDVAPKEVAEQIIDKIKEEMK